MKREIFNNFLKNMEIKKKVIEQNLDT